MTKALPGAALLCALLAMPVHARQSAARDTVVIPGARYEAGALHRFLLGPHYRAAWTQPVRVPVLDLSAFAGGLTPMQRGGGFQTRSLRFRGEDGREYAFRSIDKDPSAILPVDLRQTLVSDIVQDQISAAHPMGALVVPPILEAVGVLHATPRAVVLPDDARLGEFRADFGGLLGLIEERPEEGSDTVPGFMGATNAVSTERLFERMEENLEKVDARAFLAARLTDVYLGDWDRHRDQWRWLRFAETREALWQPVPRDRDQAFVKFDGLLLALARQYFPQLVKFGDSYARPLGITWNGREMDRRLLVELERAVWDSVANTLVQRITDNVIDAAVDGLPAELRALHADELRRGLRARRDKLPAFARDFYRMLAGEVDVNTTDAAERVRIERVSGRELTVEIIARTNTGDREVYRRRFNAGETREVRLFLHGGADSVRITGSGDASITVRVIGGGGDDVFIDETSGGNDRFYDSAGDNTFTRAGGTHVDERPYTFPGPAYSPSQPPRDWGALYRYPLWMLLAPDVGLQIGVGIDRTHYGFRQYPYDSRIRLRAAAGTGPRKIRAEFDAWFRRENSAAHWTLSARASGLDVLRFHGFGNETTLDGEDDFYLVDQMQFALESRAVLPLFRGATLSAGPAIKLTDTDANAGRLIAAVAPYGTGTFGQAGIRADVRIDARDRERAASRGVLLTLGGAAWPAVWDVEQAYGDIHAEASAYLSAPIVFSPTLALRAGGRHLLGDYPFSEAAYIGDDATVRLGRKQRYGGDSEAHINAELRLKLFRAKLVLPADFGVFGLTDTGRVFLEGEESDRWHKVAGGGIWLAFLQPQNTLSLAFARSRERTGIYVGAGFAF
jgi:hypothetical protein